MLAVQMATTHVAVVRAARRMAGADHLAQLEAHTTAHTKLSRTFTAQVEALKCHRSKGQQVVRVERVNVEPGGQAIVGRSTTGGGEAAMKAGVNPLGRADAAPRCSAYFKRTGARCGAPAVTGWTVCFQHGAGGGHSVGAFHPRWVHRMRSRAWVEERKAANEIMREARSLVAFNG